MSQSPLNGIDGDAQRILRYDFVTPVVMNPAAGIVAAMAESAAFQQAQLAAEGNVRANADGLNTRVADLGAAARESGKTYLDMDQQAAAELHGLGEGIAQ
ncbi:hypothetical protein ACOBQX_22065 [Actinokineospora sp. G85]|uniref:hypothetical protein n=1 Tax=Actinokineospora sp. G85 TaxID=3406626 RepID=UPI003C74898F